MARRYSGKIIHGTLQLFAGSPVIMTEKDDSSLVRHTLEGDHKAYEALMRKYQKPLFNVALRMVGRWDDAQDIIQTVFIRAYESLPACDPPSRFFSWIYRATINESINWLKRRNKQVELTETVASSEKLPDEEYDERNLSEEIVMAMQELSIENRVVIVLRHFADLSYRELSFVLEIPEKTVKSRLFAARRRLGSILQERGIVTHD